MKPQELIFWIIVGVLVGSLLLLVANQILLQLLKVNVHIKTPVG